MYSYLPNESNDSTINIPVLIKVFSTHWNGLRRVLSNFLFYFTLPKETEGTERQKM